MAKARKYNYLQVIQGSYAGQGYEDISEYTDDEQGRKDARADLKEYHASRTGSHRLIRRRERRGGEHADVIDSYNENIYDTDAMRTDADNGNFSPDRAEEYRHTEIVAASIVNGQFSQARQQCSRYGLIYEEQMIANGRDPWK